MVYLRAGARTGNLRLASGLPVKTKTLPVKRKGLPVPCGSQSSRTRCCLEAAARNSPSSSRWPTCERRKPPASVQYSRSLMERSQWQATTGKNFGDLRTGLWHFTHIFTHGRSQVTASRPPKALLKRVDDQLKARSVAPCLTF